MYDFSHLIYDPQPRLKVSYFDNASYNGEWQTWIKPAGAKFIYFFSLGAGGSGGCSSKTDLPSKDARASGANTSDSGR